MSLAGLPERLEIWHCWWYLFYRESRPVPKSLPKWKSALFERICSVGGGDICTIWGDSLFGANCTICGTLYFVQESALFGGTIPLWSLWVWFFIPPFNISVLMVCGL